MTNIGKFHLHKDIDKALADVKEQYTWMENRLESMQKTLNEWNKDVEIQKQKEINNYLRTHSFLQLSDKEMKDLEAFRKEHYEKCALPKRSKAVGNTYIYEITGTGLGPIIKITCPICNKSLDVTDTDSW